MMNARHLIRRRAYMEGIPSNVKIPKFMRPAEIEEVQRLKREHRDMEWSEIVRVVVFDSVPKLRAVPI